VRIAAARLIGRGVEELCTPSPVIHRNSQKEKEAKRKRNGRRRLSSSLRTATATATLNQVNRGPNNRDPLKLPVKLDVEAMVTRTHRVKQNVRFTVQDGFSDVPGITCVGQEDLMAVVFKRGGEI